MSFTVYVFRHCSAEQGAFAKSIHQTEGAVYLKGARTEDAPQSFDCLTLVHYIFRQAMKVEIPLVFIGNMPRRLLSHGDWELLMVETDNLRPGDVIFVKNRKKPKLLSHAAVALGHNQIFHSSPSMGKAKIQTLKAFFEDYEQKLSWRKALCYIDPRDKEARRKNKGKLCLDESWLPKWNPDC